MSVPKLAPGVHSPPRRSRLRTAARAVQVRLEDLVLPTYLPALPDRQPMFLEKRVYQGSSGKVYPLPFTDRIAEKPVNRSWKAVWLENEFIRALVLPELGGRIHVLQDKTNGYDAIYRQPVIKPALVGLAGPWISGGIEFNWPQHHRPATFLPTDVEIEEHADGSKTVWCGDHEPMTRMKGMHGVCLHPAKSYLELKVRAYNRTPFVQTFLWWANVATRVHEAYQSFFPPDVYYVADHARRSMSAYPLCDGFYYGVNYGQRGRTGVPAAEVPRQFVPPHCAKAGAAPAPSPAPDYAPNDLSFYANIPTPCSYMCMGSQQDFFGGYDHAARAGIIHIANHHIAPGKKQWTWGNHEFGYSWDRNLTDKDAKGEYGPYIELMAGVYTDNQPDFSFLQPGETKTWSQYWYPIQKIGPAQHANLEASLSLRCAGGRWNVGVAVTSYQPDLLVRVTARGKLLSSFRRDLSPAQPLLAHGRLPKRTKETELRISVTDRAGRELIAYQAKPRAKGPVPPPAAEPPPPAELATAEELYLTGLHLEQYRHATRCPTPYWREALRRDPLDARCNNAMGLWHLRRGEFAIAERHFRAALERLTHRNANPYDGEAYYNLGLCLRFQGRDDQAYAALYKSVWNQAWMAPGYHALAELDCTRNNWFAALDHLERSLRYNTDNLRARNLKAVVLRKLGRKTEARALLEETRKLDPLDWWARHLLGEPLRCDLQTALDLALDYIRAGLYTEALVLLRKARANGQPISDLPDQSWGAAPLVHYYLGWLYAKLSDTTTSTAHLFSAKLSDATTSADHFFSAKLCDATTSAAHFFSAKLCDATTSAAHLFSAKLCDATTSADHFSRATQSSPNFCLPARLEEIAILEAAMRANPSDARAPYYLGNLMYDRRRHAEAIRLWERAARLDPHFSVVWRNLSIGYFNVYRQPAKARAAYDRAFRADPTDARLLYERDQLWKRLGISPRRRLAELEKHRKLVQQRDDLSVELCSLYSQVGRPGDAAALLAARHFQPWEGGEGAALGQHVRSQLALGRRALAEGRAAEARRHFEAALQAPPNLGEAKHLLANQSDIHYWLGCAFSALGDGASARRHWRAAATFKGDFQEMSVRSFSEMTYFSALSWMRLGREAEGRELLKALLAHARGLASAPTKIDYFATSLPAMLLFEENLERRQKTTAIFLEAQARLGLGDTATAKRMLRTVLRRDPNHALAADYLREGITPL